MFGSWLFGSGFLVVGGGRTISRIAVAHMSTGSHEMFCCHVGQFDIRADSDYRWRMIRSTVIRWNNLRF